MPSRSRTGFVHQRAPTLRNRRAPANLQPPDHNNEPSAMRPDLLLSPPWPAQDTQPPPHDPVPEEHHYGHFHDDQERNTDPSLLPPEMVTQYAIRRDTLSAAWKSIENAMTASYFTCQNRTQNWTSSSKYLDPLEDYRFAQQQIEFCSCIPDTIRLMYHGYIAASPTAPRTAFAIPLVQLYQSLWHDSGSFQEST
ncbi:hypothetical protein PtA15_11A308 [Puccinia triticina]|uniref:CxC1-like cysteine cluster associated with KDZ transposases domain-containing protein n=1 Tax=Puccinia triticina TaxID=208348 RepID=A0ABY7CWE6_9BASI|nr:uncharacterized protein PtA15_11A308 [Puccinia triticina]WAQ89618.1 hypothetical protein PtA15_11A308 [Puccinia triticina]